jgi:hypothetical protein
VIVQVDQSIKVEQTNADTALAFSDGIQFSILIPAKVKREVIAHLRTKGKYTKRLYLWLFVLALYHLLKSDLNRINVIVIDSEYTGRDEDIRALLLQLFRRQAGRAPAIAFQQISRKSNAHKTAIAVIRGDARPNRILTASEFLEPLTARK